ncbi:hypothetical protein N7516_007529 [Penicillium verrucosum]|uniref:uncharacterized protein n=1 Tax=Penicillium verrucosum TaxID=60171 RepID=UPI0025455F7E|nr:uncharacterized protein N7516_007529 [Penicillium verrucosum]KAJ5933040.1 hypothetical protein N7516_007529 [Penicillium verrucosum]
MSSKLARSRKDKGEKKRDEAESESEEASRQARSGNGSAQIPTHPPPPRQRRDESRRAASPRPGRQQSQAAFHGPRGQPNRGPRYSRWPGRHDYRAADLTQRGLPVHTPSGPSRRAINPAAAANQASPRANQAAANNPPVANNSTNAPSTATLSVDGDVEMTPLPSSPTYMHVPLPPSSPP